MLLPVIYKGVSLTCHIKRREQVESVGEQVDGKNIWAYEE
jgi:hypothetical protein